MRKGSNKNQRGSALALILTAMLKKKKENIKRHPNRAYIAITSTGFINNN